MLELLFLAEGGGNAIGDKITEILQNAFGVNLTDFIINLSATILLFLIVRFVFWNKVTKFLDAKKEKIKEEYKDAASIKAEAEEIKKEADQTLLDSKAEANKIMVESRRDANAQREAIINEAKEESKRIIEESKAQALKQKEEILKEAKDEVISIASQMASKMIEDNVDESKYNEKALGELEGNK